MIIPVDIDELLSPLLTTTWGRRAGLSMLGLMMILACIAFIHMIWTFGSDIRLARLSSNQNANRSQANDILANLIAEIPQWHLFGKYGVVKQSAILPVTRLQIRLVGVIKATPDKFSRVIISESNQPGKIYEVGDTLPTSGVKVYAIAPDGVILNNAGRLEKLPLERTPLLFQGKPKSLLGDE